MTEVKELTLSNGAKLRYRSEEQDTVDRVVVRPGVRTERWGNSVVVSSFRTARRLLKRMAGVDPDAGPAQHGIGAHVKVPPVALSTRTLSDDEREAKRHKRAEQRARRRRRGHRAKNRRRFR